MLGQEKSTHMLGIAIIILLHIAQTSAGCDIYPLNEGSYCDCPNMKNYTEVLTNCDSQYMVAIKVHNSDSVDIEFVNGLNLRYITNSITSFIITNNKVLNIEIKDEKNIFNYFPHLTLLVMRQNHLRTLSNYLIKKSNIESLDLQHNQFSSIPKIVSVTLKKLDLTHNLISTINDEDFKHLTALEEIILEDNKLDFVDSSIFLNLSKLKRLYLYTNLWRCNCASVELFRDLKGIARTENEIECDIRTSTERILVDANGITPEFVEMCPLKLEERSENLINNGVLKHHHHFCLLLAILIVLYK